VEHNDWRSVPETIAVWRALDHCRAAATRTHGEVATRVSSCGARNAVELVAIDRGGHSWPGGARMSRLLDPPSTAVDATDTLWRFFTAHTRR